MFSKENLTVSPIGIFKNLPKIMLNAVNKAQITRVLTERNFCIKKSPLFETIRRVVSSCSGCNSISLTQKGYSFKGNFPSLNTSED